MQRHRYARWQHDAVSAITDAHRECLGGGSIRCAVPEQIGSGNRATGYMFGEAPVPGPRSIDLGDKLQVRLPAVIICSSIYDTMRAAARQQTLPIPCVQACPACCCLAKHILCRQ